MYIRVAWIHQNGDPRAEQSCVTMKHEVLAFAVHEPHNDCTDVGSDAHDQRPWFIVFTGSPACRDASTTR